MKVNFKQVSLFILLVSMQNVVQANQKNKNQEKLDHQFRCAVYDGNFYQVIELLEQGAAVNGANSPWGQTALHLAAGLNNFRMVAYLIFYGACLFAEDFYGQKPIDYAKKAGHQCVVSLLEWCLHLMENEDIYGTGAVRVFVMSACHELDQKNKFKRIFFCL